MIRQVILFGLLAAAMKSASGEKIGDGLFAETYTMGRTPISDSVLSCDTQPTIFATFHSIIASVGEKATYTQVTLQPSQKALDPKDWIEKTAGTDYGLCTDEAEQNGALTFIYNGVDCFISNFVYPPLVQACDPGEGDTLTVYTRETDREGTCTLADGSKIANLATVTITLCSDTFLAKCTLGVVTKADLTPLPTC